MYYFLREDLHALSAKIEEIADRIKEVGKEMGQSCQEGADTFHDNFANEDGQRQQYMLSTRLREMIRIRNQAHLVESQQSDKVSLGLTVTVEDENTNEVRIIKIGSYMVLAKHTGEVISYNAPLARMLISGKVGETREAIIAGKRKVLHILKIEKEPR